MSTCNIFGEDPLVSSSMITLSIPPAPTLPPFSCGINENCPNPENTFNKPNAEDICNSRPLPGCGVVACPQNYMGQQYICNKPSPENNLRTDVVYECGGPNGNEVCSWNNQNYPKLLLSNPPPPAPTPAPTPAPVPTPAPTPAPLPQEAIDYICGKAVEYESDWEYPGYCPSQGVDGQPWRLSYVNRPFKCNPGTTLGKYNSTSYLRCHDDGTGTGYIQYLDLNNSWSPQTIYPPRPHPEISMAGYNEANQFPYECASGWADGRNVDEADDTDDVRGRCDKTSSPWNIPPPHTCIRIGTRPALGKGCQKDLDLTNDGRALNPPCCKSDVDKKRHCNYNSDWMVQTCKDTGDNDGPE